MQLGWHVYKGNLLTLSVAKDVPSSPKHGKLYSVPISSPHRYNSSGQFSFQNQSWQICRQVLWIDDSRCCRTLKGGIFCGKMWRFVISAKKLLQCVFIFITEGIWYYEMIFILNWLVISEVMLCFSRGVLLYHQFLLPVCVNSYAVEWEFDNYILLMQIIFNLRINAWIWNNEFTMLYTEWIALPVPYIYFLSPWLISWSCVEILNLTMEFVR